MFCSDWNRWGTHSGEYSEDPRIAAMDAKYGDNPKVAELIEDANSGCDMASDMLEGMDAFRCEECCDWHDWDERAEVLEADGCHFCHDCVDELAKDFISHDGRNLGPTLFVVYKLDEQGRADEMAYHCDPQNMDPVECKGYHWISEL